MAESMEDKSVKGHAEQVTKDDKNLETTSNKFFLLGIVAIIVILGGLFGFGAFIKEQPKTIDDLHYLNLAGELDKEAGFLYNGFSFVYFDGLWHTTAATPSGDTLFGVYFHNAPQQVLSIPVSGELNKTTFDANNQIFISFDPIGTDLQYVALAVSKFDSTIIKVFGKEPVAACDRNETDACVDRPIITCSNTEKSVLYIMQDTEPEVKFDDNCIMVVGSRDDLIRSMERLLYLLYGIMER